MREKHHFALGMLALAILLAPCPLAGEDVGVRAQASQAEERYAADLAKCLTCGERPVILGSLGGLLRSQGRYEEARPYLEEAVRLREEDAAMAPVQRLIAMNRLILLYRDTAEHVRAQTLAEQAVALAESAGLEQTEEGAAAHTALGTLLHMRGDFAAARRYLNLALETRMKILGNKHAGVADTINNLALVELASGHLTLAEGLYRRAIAILESSPGAKDPRLPVILNNLGRLLTQQGKRREAMRLLERALAYSQPRHPDTAVILIHLAELHTDAGHFPEAEQLLARADEITRVSVAKDHPRWAALFSAQAALALAQKKFARAEELYGAAKSILLDRLPQPNAEVAAMQTNLAEILAAQQRLPEAAQELREALATLESIHGTESPRLFGVLRRYSEILRSQMDYAAAARTDARAMSIYVKSTLRPVAR